jgi:hypothetical protein
MANEALVVREGAEVREQLQLGPREVATVKDDEHRPRRIVGSLGDVDRVGATDATNIQGRIEIGHGGILAVS